MSNEYMIVSNSILPKCYMKVVEAKKLLSSGSVDNVSKACKQTGISRSTFYKYQDYVFPYEEISKNKKMSFSFSLSHKPGALSKVTSLLSDFGISILTISQSIPIDGMATIMVSCDIANMIISVDDLKKELSSLSEVNKFQVLSFE